MCFDLFKTSIGKKQIVATTGLLLVLFLILHLAGNLAIFAGPAFFNGYAEALKKVRPFVLVIELALLGVFLVHVVTTIWLVLENIKSAGATRYAVSNKRGNTPIATQLRVITGLFLLGFVVWHLFDFTFTEHHGARSLMDGQSLGLYGVVYNSFLNPIHSILYIIAMGCLGFHLAHGVQSFMQTYGFRDEKYVATVVKISNIFAIVIALGFSSIPIYIMMRG